MRRILAILWQLARTLFGLGMGLYLGRVLKAASGVSWASFAGYILMSFGGILNLIVVALNRGFMPVRIAEIPEAKKRFYKAMDEQTCVWFLGDWIRIGGWYFSPGDIGLYLGLIVAIGDVLIGVALNRSYHE
ncbi:MAG TPA: DUF5317 family protein [Verrucomicrobiae bacterium]|nr:DUF5317 family protein [Verrucomicrobiae bacterium]